MRKTDALFERLLEEALNDDPKQRPKHQPKPKPNDLYNRLMKKKQERDEKVEQMRRQQHEEETRPFRRRRSRVSSLPAAAVASVQEAACVQSNQELNTKPKQARGRQSEGPPMASTTARAARTNGNRNKPAFPSSQSIGDRSSSKRFHRSSGGSTGSSSVFDKLYQDALRRREDRKRREKLLAIEETKPFKTNKLRGQMQGREAENSKRSNRIAIFPVDSFSHTAEHQAKASPSDLPPREIVISPPIQLRAAPVKKQFTNPAPWQSPPRPIRKLPPSPFMEILDPVIVPIADPSKPPPKTSKLDSVSSLQERSDGETSAEDNSVDSTAEKTEYGSI